MTVVALIVTPVVLLYQGWTYYVFRRRLGLTESAPGPENAPIAPAAEGPTG
jgi:cytochrome d ubiquinol oxidase subunit II